MNRLPETSPSIDQRRAETSSPTTLIQALAVWVVEDASAAHVAAVDFLNRTSDNSVGYLLAGADLPRTSRR